MPKVTLDDLTNLQNETSAVNTINNNSAAIEAAIENTLSRDGTSPNEMNANLDMNNYRVFNLPAATSPTEPIRKLEFDNLTADISNAGQYAQEAKDARDAAQVAEAGALAAETFAYLWASENEDTPVDDGIRTGYSSFHWSTKSEDHATDSENAKVEAQVARDFAHAWATEAEDVPVDDGVNPPGFSAYHWAQKAEEVVVGGLDASAIDYDNAASGLTATNVQDAIDESDGRAVRKNVATVQAMSGPLVVRQSLEVRANPGGNINVALTDGSGNEVALIYAVPSTGFFALRRNLGGGSFATLKFLPTSITYNDQRLITEADIDPWAMQPIGVPVPLWDNLAGVAPPPTDRAYRYIKLTAGLTGAGQYNEGCLSGESVTGTAPQIMATATISLADSPLNGATVRLINSERRFLRPGETSGTIEEHMLQSHTHTYFRTSGTGGGASGATNFYWSGFNDQTGGPTGNAGNETRPRNIWTSYYLRIR